VPPIKHSFFSLLVVDVAARLPPSCVVGVGAKNPGEKGWVGIFNFTTDKAAHAKQHTTSYLSIPPINSAVGPRGDWCVVGCEVMRHLDATPLASHRILHLDAG